MFGPLRVLLGARAQTPRPAFLRLVLQRIHFRRHVWLPPGVQSAKLSVARPPLRLGIPVPIHPIDKRLKTGWRDLLIHIRPFTPPLLLVGIRPCLSFFHVVGRGLLVKKPLPYALLGRRVAAVAGICAPVHAPPRYGRIRRPFVDPLIALIPAVMFVTAFGLLWKTPTRVGVVQVPPKQGYHVIVPLPLPLVMVILPYMGVSPVMNGHTRVDPPRPFRPRVKPLAWMLTVAWLVAMILLRLAMPPSVTSNILFICSSKNRLCSQEAIPLALSPPPPRQEV